MNEDDIITRENTPSPHEQRREPRLHFESTCFLSMLSPAWVMTRSPLAGLTRNITQNGMRVDLPRLPAKQFKVWEDTLREESRIRVEVSLGDAGGDVSPLQGQVVWLSRTEQEEEERSAPADPEWLSCSVGILFAIMPEERSRALRALVESLTNS